MLPQFIEAWSPTNTQAGWLAGIVSAGYMLAVIPLVSLTDRRPATLGMTPPDLVKYHDRPQGPL